MRKVIYSTMVSVDGFIEKPDRNLDWVVIDAELHTFINEQQRSIDTYLFGRRMYEVMVSWETIGQDKSNPDYIMEYARIWKNIHKIVFSKTLDRVEGNATLNRGNIVDEIKRLKTEPGQDLSVGGATIAATLRQHDLIDEYQLFVQPAIIGNGTPAFPVSDRQTNLRLTDTHTFHSGVMMLQYQRVNRES